MELVSVAIITSGLLLFSLVSGKLQGTIITAPLVFIIFGFLVGDGGLAIASIDPGHSIIHTIAEFTLIVVLFTDAARLDLKRLWQDHNLPTRMLILGLPLIVVSGAIIAMWIFPALTFWEAALLAALLAPTDAALGQSVVSATIVPVRIRQAINVESGLNDGIILPAVLLLAVLAESQSEISEVSTWIHFGLLQITLGPLVGMLTGYIGARMIDTMAERRWMNTSAQGVGILSLAMLTYALAELVGGNGFIATFVAGMMFGNTIRNTCSFLFEFMETEGQLLMLITFLIFGAAMLPEGLHHMTPSIFLYAVLSLTVIRIIPITISLIGTGLRLPTIAFLGWFGPRGLASILFVLLILEESKIVHHDELYSITIVTVALSALLHGITAAPFANWYGQLAGRMGECEENQKVSELSLRERPANTKIN
jgi:NhaP-type Na+/H+ or K+/H+ antiporter